LGALTGQIVNAVSTFLLIVIIARSLGPGGAGSYFLMVTAVTVLALTAQLGATTGLVRLVAKDRSADDLSRIPSTVIAAVVPSAMIGTVFAIILFLGSPTLADWTSEPDVAAYGRMWAPVIPVWALSVVALSALRGAGAIRPYVLAENVVRPSLQLLLTIVVVAVSSTAHAAAIAWSVPFLLQGGMTGAAVYVHARTGTFGSWKAGRLFRADMAVEYWRFTAPQAAGATVQIVAQRLDVFLLGFMASAGDVAVYGAALRYLAGAGMLLGAVILAAGPRLAVLFEEAEDLQAAVLFQQVSAAVSAIGVPFYAGLALFAPAAMAVFGSGFIRGADTLSIMAVATAFNLAAGPVIIALAMAGYSRLTGLITAAASLCGLCLDVLLIPGYGMAGAAVGYAVAVFLANASALIALYAVRHMHPFGPPSRMILMSVLVSIVPIGVAWRFVQTSSLSVSFLFAASAGITYCAVVWKRRSAFSEAMNSLFEAAKVDRERPLAVSGWDTQE
jgi:O-antigen/teichoic acid export membrane protein